MASRQNAMTCIQPRDGGDEEETSVLWFTDLSCVTYTPFHTSPKSLATSGGCLADHERPWYRAAAKAADSARSWPRDLRMTPRCAAQQHAFRREKKTQANCWRVVVRGKDCCGGDESSVFMLHGLLTSPIQLKKSCGRQSSRPTRVPCCCCDLVWRVARRRVTHSTTETGGRTGKEDRQQVGLRLLSLIPASREQTASFPPLQSTHSLTVPGILTFWCLFRSLVLILWRENRKLVFTCISIKPWQ